MAWEFGVSRRQLLHTERINNQVLLHSAGNCLQHSITNHNGKTMKKHACLCNWVTLLYRRFYHSIVNQLYFDKTVFLKSPHVIMS